LLLANVTLIYITSNVHQEKLAIEIAMMSNNGY